MPSFKNMILTCAYGFAFGCMLGYTLSEGFTPTIMLLWTLYVGAVFLALRNATH